MIQRRQAILVGLDNLGHRIFQELRNAQIDVSVINKEPTEFDKDVQARGGKVLIGNLRDKQLLIDAGLGRTQTIIIVTPDDTINLIVALNALELNPQIQIVLRHFNLSLAQRIEEQIPNSKVLSPDSIGASAFAIAAHNANTFLSFQFLGKPMTFFNIHTSEYPGFVGQQVGAIDQAKGIKIIALDSLTVHTKFPEPDLIIPEDSTLVAFGPLPKAQEFASKTEFKPLPEEQVQEDRRKNRGFRYWLNHVVDPILAWTITGTVATIVVGTLYFFLVENKAVQDSWVNAIYFVFTTLSTTGYGDFSMLNSPWYSKFTANVVMFAGLTLAAIIFAMVTNALMAKRMDIMMGRRKVHKAGHIVVCGLGATGIRIVEELGKLGEQVVVIESGAENKFIERARSLDAQLIIADASSPETLRFANVRQARCLISAIENDMLNLEIGLSAVAMNPNLRIILRIYQPELTKHLTKRFNIDLTYSTADLAAPAFVSPALHEAENELTTLELDEKAHAVIEKLAPEFVDGAGMTLKEVYTAREMFILAVASPDGKLVIAPPPDTPVQKGDRALFVKRAVQRTWTLIGKAGQSSKQ